MRLWACEWLSDKSSRTIFQSSGERFSLSLPIRIWVPACSSGEEVYSIAISLVEFLGKRAVDYPIQIYGTDISETAIARARAGVYHANIAQDISPTRLLRFFAEAEDRFRIVKSYREPQRQAEPGSELKNGWDAAPVFFSIFVARILCTRRQRLPEVREPPHPP